MQFACAQSTHTRTLIDVTEFFAVFEELFSCLSVRVRGLRFLTFDVDCLRSVLIRTFSHLRSGFWIDGSDSRTNMLTAPMSSLGNAIIDGAIGEHFLGG